MAAFLVLTTGCSDTVFRSNDRTAGERTPLTAPCDDADPLRCSLPFPSNTFTVVDETTDTGLRLKLDPAVTINDDDDPIGFSHANGFSVVSPVFTGFSGAVIAPPPGSLQVIIAQPDHDGFGTSVPLRLVTRVGPNEFGDGDESLVMGYPLRPLDPNTDYVVVLTDDVTAADGSSLPRSRATEVAMGLAEPASQAEADLAGYHGPTRRIITNAGIDQNRVLRAWDFTTRTTNDATKRIRSMRRQAIAAIRDGNADVIIDSVQPRTSPISVVIEGRITGLPNFLSSDNTLSLDAGGLPEPIGTREAPFRAMIPEGSGDYRFVMYGHGTGGNYHDANFDQAIAEVGAGKLGIQFYGWTDETVVETFTGFLRPFVGAQQAAAQLCQAVADENAILEAARGGKLREILGAATINGQANPAAGRFPDTSRPIWTGGSLGGTMGLVITMSDPTIEHGVLNVPGGAWSHFINDSSLVGLVSGLFRLKLRGDLNLSMSMGMVQTLLDYADGAPWYHAVTPDEAPTFLIQESIDDPVLPNPGSEMVAVVGRAVQIGVALVPIADLRNVNAVSDESGITQFKVTGDEFDVHGFAAQNGTPAANAAQQQIVRFVTSAWNGKAFISVPELCKSNAPDGNCDFSE